MSTSMKQHSDPNVRSGSECLEDQGKSKNTQTFALTIGKYIESDVCIQARRSKVENCTSYYFEFSLIMTLFESEAMKLRFNQLTAPFCPFCKFFVQAFV